MHEPPWPDPTGVHWAGGHTLKNPLSPPRWKGLCAPSSPGSFPPAQGGRTAWCPAEHMGRGRRSVRPAPLRSAAPARSPLRSRPPRSPRPPRHPRARGAPLTGVKAAGEGDAGQGRLGGGSVRSSPACTRHGGPGTAPALPGRCGSAPGGDRGTGPARGERAAPCGCRSSYRAAFAERKAAPAENRRHSGSG